MVLYHTSFIITMSCSFSEKESENVTASSVLVSEGKKWIEFQRVQNISLKMG